MTRQNIITAFEMKMDGYTYQQIGERFGVTKQWVQQTFQTILNRQCKPFVCVYPHLENWMLDHGYSPHRLYLEMTGNDLPSSSSVMKLKLSGKREFNMSEMIKLVSLTDMPLELLFDRTVVEQ